MIADVTLYQDTGYTMGGHHVCRRGSVPTAASGTTASFPDVKISFQDVNTVDLIIPYMSAMSYSYIAIDCDYGLYYGWITDVKLISTKTIEVCRITWQWDYWRSWGHHAVLGSGRLTRRVTPVMRPDNVMRGHYQERGLNTIDVVEKTNLNDYTSDIQTYFRSMPWVVLQYIATTGSDDNVKTEIQTICWPANGIMVAYSDTTPTTANVGLSLERAYRGYIDEDIDLDPNSIIGAWVTPICPFPEIFDLKKTMSESLTIYYWQPNSNYITIKRKQIPDGIVNLFYACFVIENIEIQYDLSVMADPHSYSFTIDPGINDLDKNTLKSTVYLTDFLGNLAWTMPYGLQMQNKTGYYGFSFSPLSGQMIVSFLDADGGDYLDSTSEGLVASLPLPTLPISSNTWQSYVLSGQRDYEIEAAKQSAEAAYIKGLTNVGVGAIEGALAGSITSPGIGTVAGAAIGQASSIISSTINKATEESLREKVQGLKDVAVAHQQQTLIVPGQSPLWYTTGHNPCLISLVSQDRGEYDAYVSEYGYNDDMAYASCDALVPTTQRVGPIQIDKLDVSGPIPAAARLQIKDMFSKGVYIE